MTNEILCLDCGADLDGRVDWEPIIRIVGPYEIEHARICFACIADMEDIGFREIISQCRTELARAEFQKETEVIS